MEELSFRLTRLTYFDEIVSLSEGIYEGHDYLPVEFHKWMRMENMAIMLVLSGKKMIGSRAAYITDDGKTYIRRAGRVLLEFRKQSVQSSRMHWMNMCALASQLLSECVSCHNITNLATV